MNLKQMTATDYLEMKDKARRNGADKPSFKRMTEELHKMPEIEERLALEILGIVIDTLRKGISPRGLFGEVLRFDRSIGKDREPTYLKEVENVVSLSFDLLGKEDSGTGQHFAHEYTVRMGLIALQKRNPDTFRTTISKLTDLLRREGDERSVVLSKVAN